MRTIYLQLNVPDGEAQTVINFLSRYEVKPDEKITLSEARRRTGISPVTLDKWVNKLKLIPCNQVANGHKYIRWADLQALLEVREQEKAKPRRRKTILDVRVR